MTKEATSLKNVRLPLFQFNTQKSRLLRARFLHILEARVGAGFFYLSFYSEYHVKKAYLILFLSTIGKIPLLR